MKSLRQSSTGHAYTLPLPGLSSVSFVGTGRPLAFLVRFGMATGFGRRRVLRPLLNADFGETFSLEDSEGSSSKTRPGGGEASGTSERSEA